LRYEVADEPQGTREFAQPFIKPRYCAECRQVIPFAQVFDSLADPRVERLGSLEAVFPERLL